MIHCTPFVCVCLLFELLSWLNRIILYYLLQGKLSFIKSATNSANVDALPIENKAG